MGPGDPAEGTQHRRPPHSEAAGSAPLSRLKGKVTRLRPEYLGNRSYRLLWGQRAAFPAGCLALWRLLGPRSTPRGPGRKLQHTGLLGHSPGYLFVPQQEREHRRGANGAQRGRSLALHVPGPGAAALGSRGLARWKLLNSRVMKTRVQTEFQSPEAGLEIGGLPPSDGFVLLFRCIWAIEFAKKGYRG